MPKQKRRRSSGKKAPKVGPTILGGGSYDHHNVEDPVDMLDEELGDGQVEFLTRLNPYVCSLASA